MFLLLLIKFLFVDCLMSLTDVDPDTALGHALKDKLDLEQKVRSLEALVRGGGGGSPGGEKCLILYYLLR